LGGRVVLGSGGAFPNGDADGVGRRVCARVETLEAGDFALGDEGEAEVGVGVIVGAVERVFRGEAFEAGLLAVVGGPGFAGGGALGLDGGLELFEAGGVFLWAIWLSCSLIQRRTVEGLRWKSAAMLVTRSPWR
jgi:hypothetical protein